MTKKIYLVEWAMAMYVVAENDNKALEKANIIKTDTLDEPRVNRLTYEEMRKLEANGELEAIEKNGFIIKYVGE